MKGKNGIGSFISFPDRAEQPYMRLGATSASVL